MLSLVDLIEQHIKYSNKQKSLLKASEEKRKLRVKDAYYTCSKCGMEKHSSEFDKDKSRIHGIRSECSECSTFIRVFM